MHPNADKRQTHWTDHLPLHSDLFSKSSGIDHEPTTLDTITPVRSKETQWIIFPESHSPPSTGSDTTGQHSHCSPSLCVCLLLCFPTGFGQRTLISFTSGNSFNYFFVLNGELIIVNCIIFDLYCLFTMIWYIILSKIMQEKSNILKNIYIKLYH